MANRGGKITRLAAVTSVTVLAGIGTMAASAMAASPGNLVTNGSFESPAIPANSYADHTTGSTAVTGWTVTGDSIDVVSNTYNGYWTAEDGVQSIDLAGNDPGGLTQTVATTPGVSYTLSWYSAANGDLSSGTHQTTVTAGGATISTVTTTTTYHQINWMAESATFTATSASTTLAFTDTTPGGDGPQGPLLDNVSLAASPTPALPEASSVGLLGLAGVGVVGGALYLRRRRSA